MFKNNFSFFKGRKVCIATRHKKEQVIAPILEKELGLVCFTPPNFDTDQLGTFSGEVERKEDALATIRQKCLLAMKEYKCDLAIASEGSFGPHPSLFFVPSDHELLLLVDGKNNLEILEQELSLKTNFNGAEIKTIQELEQFSEQIDFPQHAIILSVAKNNFEELHKGITSLQELKRIFSHLIDKYGSAYAQTDMRAMHNPMRMKVIETVTQKLVSKLKSLCPVCSTPGYGAVASTPGLPCKQCGNPTRSALSHTYSCIQCKYNDEKFYPNGNTHEDPMYCDVCNP